MTDAVAFIAAIHAAPDDAAPRLVYADWLDDNGEAGLADLIRRMCRVPTYEFKWSRRAQHGRHAHAESIGAIRGLRGRVETVFDVFVSYSHNNKTEVDDLVAMEPPTQLEGLRRSAGTAPRVCVATAHLRVHRSISESDLCFFPGLPGLKDLQRGIQHCSVPTPGCYRRRSAPALPLLG